jgi:Sugar phosphate isomerases/epimerases
MQLEQISVNLYSLRDFLKTREDFVASIKRLSAIGFQSVQLSGVAPGLMPEADFVSICADSGIKITATHEPSVQLLAEPQRSVERLGRLGVSLTAYPSPAGIDLADEAAVSRWLQDLDRAAAVLRAAGITLCYHNHHQEFTRLGGRLLLERIYAETSLAGEPDTYWIQAGGGNPLEWTKRLAEQKRLPLIHLKDYRVTAKAEVQFAELGAGNLDFDPILEAATAGGCQSFIIEQDTTYGRDPFESVAESFRFLQSRVARR